MNKEPLHVLIDRDEFLKARTAPVAFEGLTVPLMTLLYEAPEAAVFLVQDAIRAVAAGDWKSAARLMNFAVEARPHMDGWAERAARASDELAEIYKRVRIAKANGVTP